MTSKTARSATWRARLPVVAVVVACVAGVVTAVTGATNPVSSVQFLLPGHWVYNSALDKVFHVDGATGNVDAEAHIPDNPGDLVVQGDVSGYVVGSRITPFGKSDLTVGPSAKAASSETPAHVETAGGPYLVYREAGKIARLGDPAFVLSVGGPVGDPVATKNGTVWLPRTSEGLLCEIRSGQRSVTCQLQLPEGHLGAMTVVNDRPMFVDTTEDALYPVEQDGLGAARPMRVDAPERAKVASTDVDGKVAILDGNEMHLVDTRADGAAKAVEPVRLPEGDYAGPVSTGSVVAVVDRKTNTLLTYDSEGEQRSKQEMPAQDGDPRLSRGEDERVYVDGATGEHVLVVDRNGDVKVVPTPGDGDGESDAAAPENPPENPPQNPPLAGPQPNQPQVEERPPPVQDEPRRAPTVQNPPPTPDRAPEPPPRVPATPPGAPGGVSATAGNGTATVNWGPAQDNRSPITSYTVSWAGGSLTVAPGSGPAQINNLVNGQSYVFTVAATNGVGTGPGASSSPVTPLVPTTPASEPANPQVVYDPETRDADLSWGAPADLGNGTLLHYLVNVTGVGDQAVGGLSASFDNLQAVGTVAFTVRAVTQGPAGNQLLGAPATVTAEAPPIPQQPVPDVHLSQGSRSEEYCEESPDCAWMQIELTRFPPETEVKLMPHPSEPYNNPGHATVTDGNGNRSVTQFAFAGVGQTVRIAATMPDGTVYWSNTITWRAA